ncbi:MAG TPA: hypothetical protein VJ852_09780 [Gemmatimonadaceae bacterium]|nr:hypothetical protein [Gemmatimonadaceae bacterium]
MKIREALLSELIDYAGLFPPAGEDMKTAVENYGEYLRGPDRSALGRFIVPFARLEELEDAAADLFPRTGSSKPWRISVLVADDVRHAAEAMGKFNARHAARSRRGLATIEVAELKASTIEEIANQQRDLPRTFTSYFEIPLGADVRSLVHAIREVSSRAKVRTGGITVEAFPSPQPIIDFMIACHAESVPFKATAGLHHPLRGQYRLTYEQGSVQGTMYGFLNVFIAAALIAAGEGEDVAQAALEETNANAFEFGDDYLQWRDKRITAAQLADVRSHDAISFGSCSFREPIDELQPFFARTPRTPART